MISNTVLLTLAGAFQLCGDLLEWEILIQGLGRVLRFGISTKSTSNVQAAAPWITV